MSVSQVTPQASTNPFDIPLSSEGNAPAPVQPQRTAQGPPASDNPFDAPLASEQSKPEEVGTIAIPSAGRIPGVMMPAPKVTPGQAVGGLAAGAAAGTAPLVGAEVLPAVLPHTIEGVKALGAWATKNPMQAYVLYQVAKEFIPGVKKALGMIDKAPTP